jgi:hypothetical protein
MAEVAVVGQQPVRRNVALWLGGLGVAVVLALQGSLAWWFASVSPEATWRTLLGVVLGLAAPTAGGVAYLRWDHSDQSPEGRIGHVERVMAVVGLGLIVPTLTLVVVFVIVSGKVF